MVKTLIIIKVTECHLRNPLLINRLQPPCKPEREITVARRNQRLHRYACTSEGIVLLLNIFIKEK